jgi:hypothetical protein
MRSIREMHEEETMKPEISVADRIAAMKTQEDNSGWQKQVRRY